MPGNTLGPFTKPKVKKFFKPVVLQLKVQFINKLTNRCQCCIFVVGAAKTHVSVMLQPELQFINKRNNRCQ